MTKNNPSRLAPALVRSSVAPPLHAAPRCYCTAAESCRATQSVNLLSAGRSRLISSALHWPVLIAFSGESTSLYVYTVAARTVVKIEEQSDSGVRVN